MAKNRQSGSTDITRIGGLPLAPSFMGKDGREGTDELREKMRPPRIKVVQDIGSEELRERGMSPGDVLMMPSGIRLCSGSEKYDEVQWLRVTPIYFFMEWCKWNDIAFKGRGFPILERSFDSTSEIARKARDPDKRKEPIPGEQDKFYLYVEHLNFVIAIHGVDGMQGVPCVVSFHRGEHKIGTRFSEFVAMRQAAIYGGIYEIGSTRHKNPQYQWWGLDVRNPPENPWVDEGTYAEMKKGYDAFKELHENREIEVPYDDGAEEQQSPDKSEY